MLGLALHTLRWRPEDLWRATPRELAAAVGFARRAERPAARADLDRLIAAYPDPT